VRWDWVSPLAALLMLLELFNLWWQLHKFSGSTVGEVLPYFAVLILLFLAASASLPDELPPGEFDLGDYFDRTRPYFWSVYTAYVAVWVALSITKSVRMGVPLGAEILDHAIDMVTIRIRFALIFIRPRIWSGLALLGIISILAYYWLPMGLSPAN
jgi:hypothetical protein